MIKSLVVTKDQVPEEFGLTNSLVTDHLDTKILQPFTVIWVLGEIKHKIGITYGYQHFTAARADNKWALLGWPHPAVIDRSPVYCCVPNQADEITLMFIKDMKNAILNSGAA